MESTNMPLKAQGRRVITTLDDIQKNIIDTASTLKSLEEELSTILSKPEDSEIPHETRVPSCQAMAMIDVIQSQICDLNTFANDILNRLQL